MRKGAGEHPPCQSGFCTSSPDVGKFGNVEMITASNDVKPFPRRSLIKFSRNLRRLRHREKMTQEMLAERLDITPRWSAPEV